MFNVSPMWAEFDLANRSNSLAVLYWDRLGLPAHAEQILNEAATYFKDLVEHNPSIATFDRYLSSVNNNMIAAAMKDHDRQHAAAWSKDAVTFWNRQLELHPDLPTLKTYADDTIENDAKVAQWLAQPASTPATSTQP